MNLLIESRRSKGTFIKSRWGRLRVPGLARGSHKTPALFTMLIGAHVKHKFMLKAEMLSSSQMRSGADRSCLPVPNDQPPASRCFETQDNVGIYLRYVYRRSIFFFFTFCVLFTANKSFIFAFELFPLLFSFFFLFFFHHSVCLLRYVRSRDLFAERNEKVFLRKLK